MLSSSQLSAFSRGAIFLLGLEVSGCGTNPHLERQDPRGALSQAIIGTVPTPPRALQKQGMSFADRFALEWDMAADLLAGPGRPPEARVAVLAWRVQQTSQILDLAVGPDPRMSLLDLAVFLRAGEYALREGLVEGMPASARDYLVEMYGRLAAEADRMVAEILLPEQVDKLEGAISGWLASQPGGIALSGARVSSLPDLAQEDLADLRKTSGLLATVRQWLGEVNTSLLFGERVLFLAERTPRVLSQQTDLTLAQIGRDFPLATWKPDLQQVGDLLEELPARLGRGWSRATEEAEGTWLGEMGDGLWQETRLTAQSSREFLQAATGLSLALQTTLGEVNLWWKEERQAEDSPGVLALVEQARLSLERLESTLASLQALLATPGSIEAGSLQAAVGQGIENVLDQVFYRALILLLVAFVGGVLLLLLARWLFSPARKQG